MGIMICLLNKKNNLFLLLSVLLSAVAMLFVQNAVSSNVCFDTTWPSDHSSLKPAPDLVRGTLENGFRYVIKKNSEPENRAAIYLDVQAGSLNESDKQRGLAHFLEHMMFNGSTNFPPGSLIEYFQSIGMSFGNDTNAHTSYGETVYYLILPHTDIAELEKGLLVTADYSRNALLLDSEIERERGVIFSEKRARDSAAYRTFIARSAFAYRGTMLPERMVIGIDTTLHAADHNLLASYYDSWYRPENFVLVVVGDFEPAEVERLVKKNFSLIKPKGERPECPAFGKLEHKGIETFYHYEPELGKTNVSIETLWDVDLQNDSIKLEKRDILKYLSGMIMSYRLQRIQEEENPPFTQAAYYSSDIVNRIEYGTLTAVTTDEHWSETLSFIDHVLRQAITYGFKKDELERGKKELIAGLDSRVLTSQTTDSRKIGREIIRHLNSNRVYMGPEGERDLYGPIIENLTLDEVNREFRAIWAHNSRLVSVSGDADLGENANALISEKYSQSEAGAVRAPENRVVTDFPYLKIPGGKTVLFHSTKFPEIGVEKLVFENGVVVNLKKTDFVENSFQLAVSFGNGKRSEPEPGMAFMAQAVVNGSGSGQLPQSAIDTLTAGSSVSMSFRVGDAAFSWAGGALYKDFEFFVQLLHTRIFDPGLRQSVFETAMSRAEMMYKEMGQEIEGAMALEVRPFLAGGNSRFGLPAWDKISSIYFTDLDAWMRSALKINDMEISLVGDFDRANVIKILGQYFGHTVFREKTVPKTVQIHFPAGGSREVSVKTSIDKSLVVVAWPTDDFWDIKRTRRLNILSAVFEDRLRKAIRESMGATYSPDCYSWGSRAYSQYGFLAVQMTVKPGMENIIVEKIMEISEKLHSEGVTADELLRARKPTITSLKDSVKNNQYWLYSVLFQSTEHPEQLEWPENILTDYASISKKEVDTLAKRYLQSGTVAVIKVHPEGSTANPGKL